MNKPRTPRRGSVGIGAGSALSGSAVGHMLHTGGQITPGGEPELTVPHYALAIIAGLVTTVAPFLIEKVKDWLSERTGGRLDLTDTANALIAAVADGRISRDEAKDVFGEAFDDVADLFDGDPQTDPDAEYDPDSTQRATEGQS